MKNFLKPTKVTFIALAGVLFFATLALLVLPKVFGFSDAPLSQSESIMVMIGIVPAFIGEIFVMLVPGLLLAVAEALLRIEINTGVKIILLFIYSYVYASAISDYWRQRKNKQMIKASSVSGKE